MVVYTIERQSFRTNYYSVRVGYVLVIVRCTVRPNPNHSGHGRASIGPAPG